jgi:tRNA1Val (adenine37-N6)-methyltransferase
MPQETFVFKQFTIQQDKCPMKVGTDAVLLGAWIKPTNEKRILDIGTGTGILAIMLAQKSTALIDAIDIDISAVEQAKQNAEFCKWRDRVNVEHITLQQYSKQTDKRYDLIVANPPYFKDSFKPLEEGRTLARHNDYLPFDELVEGVIALLEKKGKFFVILPNKEAGILKDLAEKKGLEAFKTITCKNQA